MRVPRLTPRAYQRITLVAVIALGFIIVTGGAVRLTGSGLGCPQWPNCSAGHLAPRAANDSHAMVEFVNRTVTGLVSVAVIVAVLGSLVRTPRRRDLVWLSCGLVVGVLVQIVLGALVVDELLAPPWVMAHFLVSIVLLANALVLHRRASAPDGERATPVVEPALVWVGRAMVVVTAFVVVAGTVVTGAGPHSGDVPGTKIKATRLDLNISDVARVHGTLAMTLLALTVVMLWLVRRTRAPISVQRRLTFVLLVLVAQAAIGYVQYFTGVPALLVAFHIGGATVLWIAVVCFYLGLFEPRARATVGPEPRPASDNVLASA
jgi:heme a synthase